MKDRELYDKVKYAEGDKVRRKYRNSKDDIEVEIVDRTVIVTNIDGFKFAIIFFKSNPKSPFVSAEFEPSDSVEREAYYTHWVEAKSLLDGTKTKSKAKGKTGAKTFKMIM